MIKKTKKEVQRRGESANLFDKSERKSTKSLDKGVRTIKDIFAPSYIGHPAPDHLVVGGKYVRSYSLQGYPMSIYVK